MKTLFAASEVAPHPAAPCGDPEFDFNLAGRK